MTKSLRSTLVRTALAWEKSYGVCPAIVSSISEYDAARLVGLTSREYSESMQDVTAVRKGFDFKFNNRRYQIKTNRPSGKPGSRVTRVGKVRNYDWDVFIWILYDTKFRILEARKWSRRRYEAHFEDKRYLTPNDYRKGQKLKLGAASKLPASP